MNPALSGVALTCTRGIHVVEMQSPRSESRVWLKRSLSLLNLAFSYWDDSF